MSAPEIADQTILLTGAANGLGRALAAAFAVEGASLILVDVDAAGLADTMAGLPRGSRAIVRACDLADAGATEAMMLGLRQSHPRIDTLIHNAGYLVPEPFAGMSRRSWDITFNVGIQAAYLMTKALWDDWMKLGGGAAIYLSSRSGIEGAVNHSAYTATKHAIEGLVKVLGPEGAPHGIQVHAVTPGMYMRTPMSERNYTDELKTKWVDPMLLTSGIVHLARRADPDLSGKRLSAWDLSEAVRAGRAA